MVKYKRFHPDLWRIVFNFEAIGSVISTDDGLEVNGHFRTIGDYLNLIWTTEDVGMHEYCKYKSDRDYSDTVISFSIEKTDTVIDYHNTILPPALIIDSYNENKGYFVTLGFHGVKNRGSSTGVFDKEVDLDHEWLDFDTVKVKYIDENGLEKLAVEGKDFEIGYPVGKLYTTAGSSIAFNSELTIEYVYNTHERYTLDFNKLFEGNHPALRRNVDPKHIFSVRFPIVPAYYEEGNKKMLGRSDTFKLRLNDYVITGGDLNEIPAPKKAHKYRVAEGYDDEYHRNPKRLIECMKLLGYEKLINLYIGASHYYDKYGEKDKEIGEGVDEPHKSMTVNAKLGINESFKTWLDNYVYHSRVNGFNELVISVSMENLQLPNAWKQYMFDSVPGMTGWVPSTNFYDPNIPDVLNFIGRVTRETLDIVDKNGMQVILQLGEPWWWWQEFVPSEYGDMSREWPGQPPCFYNEATMNRVKKDLGEDLPIYNNSHTTNVYRNEKFWELLKQYLGNFSEFMKDISKDYSNSLYTVLFFPPSVLDKGRVPIMMRTVNTPFHVWDNNQLDFIQIEDYDWVIHRDFQHIDVYPFAWEHMGYRFDEQHYFTGFVLRNDQADELWPLIEHAGAGALGRGFKEVVVWAGTQIRRDSWVPRENYYVSDCEFWKAVKFHREPS